MNKLKYLLFITLFSAAAFSCKVTEDYEWDDSPAIRMEKELARYQEVLTSAPNGWIVNYYTGFDVEKNGYTMLMRFYVENEVWKVDVALDSDIAEKAHEEQSAGWPAYPAGSICTSRYELKGDQGPALNFTDYNNILHYFSNPESSPPSGREGDAGFIFKGGDKNGIELKGKKTRRYMSMIPMPEDVTWGEYIAQVKALRSTLSPAYEVKIDGENYGEALVASHNVVFMLKQTTDTITTIVKKRFGYNINVPGTVLLSKELEVDGVMYKEFSTSDNGRTLVSGDGSFVMTAAKTTIADLFAKTTTQWDYDTLAWSPSFQQVLDKLKDNLSSSFAVEYRYMYMGYSPLPDDIYDGTVWSCLWFDPDPENGGMYQSLYPMAYTPVEGTEDRMSFLYLEDQPGLNETGDLYTYGFKVMLDAMSDKGKGPFILENLSADLNPSRLKFTSSKDPNFYWVLYLTED